MKVIEKVSRTFWEEVAENCTYATFFHTPHWADLMSKSFSWKDVTKGFIFEDGTRAVIPMMKRKKNLLGVGLTDYISGAQYVYGGPIAEKTLSAEKYDEIIEHINATFKKYDTILIRGNPFTTNSSLDGYREVKDCSHVVELYKYKNEKELLKSYRNRIVRQNINIASRSNLILKKANTIDQYESLYKLYQKSFKYWSKKLTNYHLSLFTNIYLLKNEKITFRTVYFNGKMIAGELVLLWNNHYSAFLSFNDREHSKLHPRRYMLHNIFLDGMDKGIKYYDFLQSGGIQGVQKFKESMGATKYAHSAWIKENMLLKTLRNIKGKINFLK